MTKEPTKYAHPHCDRCDADGVELKQYFERGLRSWDVISAEYICNQCGCETVEPVWKFSNGAIADHVRIYDWYDALNGDRTCRENTDDPLGGYGVYLHIDTPDDPQQPFDHMFDAEYDHTQYVTALKYAIKLAQYNGVEVENDIIGGR